MNIDSVKICDGIDNMNFEEVTKMLSQARWSKGIRINEVKQGAMGSALVVGAFYENNQIGYARVISDKTRFAYVADVYVNENFRNLGIAKKMMKYIITHESLRDVYQWLLRSAANELYEKVGFSPVSEPERWMEIRNKRPER